MLAKAGKTVDSTAAEMAYQKDASMAAQTAALTGIPTEPQMAAMMDDQLVLLLVTRTAGSKAE